MGVIDVPTLQALALEFTPHVQTCARRGVAAIVLLIAPPAGNGDAPSVYETNYAEAASMIEALRKVANALEFRHAKPQGSA